MAVEDIASPAPSTTAPAQPTPAACASAASAAPHSDKLRGAQPEHRAAHHPQPLRPQFQPDQEQQHDHAEAGDIGDLVRHR